MDLPFVAQVTEDLNTRKVLQTRETIITFTGRLPKDATHIEDLKHVIETFPHPNLEGVVGHQDTGGTIPVDSNVWEKLLDWHDLSTEQQNETIEFLLMRFSVDDLQLAWDQYYVQKGEIPNSIQYRIFINNWRGNKSTRRTQSLAEMMRALEQKDDEIHRERDEHRLLHSQMDLVTHIYNGQLRHLQDVEQENDILRDTIHHMEDEDERKTQDNNHLREITEVQGRHVYQLRRTITEKDRQLCDKCSRLRDLEDTKGEYESVIKRQRLTIKEKKDQVNEKCATINEQSATINEQSATINEQSAIINEVKVENNEIKVENNEQSAIINEVKVENNELKVENNEQSAIINEQSAIINEVKVENNELKVENNELKVENNEQSAIINELIEQNHDRCKTINDLAEENNNKTKEIDELKKKVNVEVYVSQTKEEMIAEQSQIIEEQKAQLEEQREMIKRYQDNDREIKKELAQQAMVNQDLYDQLEDVKKLCNKLMMKIQEKNQKQ